MAGSMTMKSKRKLIEKKIEFPEKLIDFYQEIMKVLDISIYNLQYDFWIFITVWSIIKSNIIQLNSTFQKEVVGLFPISGFINHTCSSPNIKVRNFPLSLYNDNNNKLGYGIIIEACKDI